MAATYNVIVQFTNGQQIYFPAQEFDLDFSGLRRSGPSGSRTMEPSLVQKFTYTGPDGDKIPLYLTPNEVAGIVVKPSRYA